MDHDFHLSVDDLKSPPGQTERRERYLLKREPLVILNVRDNYCRDPEQIWNYIHFFLNSAAMGVIASELPLPSQLAVRFADHFYRNLVRNGKPLGQILADTKSAMLDEGNPFAMFYAPYFDPNARLGLEREMPIRSAVTPPQPPVAAIRELLTAAFSAEELRIFCHDNLFLKPVVSRFGVKYNLEDMVEEVIVFCEKRTLWDKLLATIKEARPDKYPEFEPRFASPSETK